MKNTKRCFRCKAVKPLDGFYLIRRHSTERQTYCKPCKAEQAHIYWQKNRERLCEKQRIHWQENRERLNEKTHIYRQENRELVRKRAREFAARRRKNPVRMALLRKYEMEWQKGHPQQVRANDAVQRALKKGVLVRERCEKCGASPAQAHHDDYSKPLDVRWLCPLDHCQYHRELRKR